MAQFPKHGNFAVCVIHVFATSASLGEGEEKKKEGRKSQRRKFVGTRVGKLIFFPGVSLKSFIYKAWPKRSRISAKKFLLSFGGGGMMSEIQLAKFSRKLLPRIRRVLLISVWITWRPECVYSAFGIRSPGNVGKYILQFFFLSAKSLSRFTKIISTRRKIRMLVFSKHAEQKIYRKILLKKFMVNHEKFEIKSAKK